MIKDILISNFTRFDFESVKSLIVKKKLFGVSIKVPADAMSDDVVKLAVQYGLSVYLPIDCIEKGRNSIAEILKRNPDFLTQLESIGAGMVYFLRESKRESGASSFITLAHNYPYRVVVLRSAQGVCSFYEDLDLYEQYINSIESADDLPNSVQFLASIEKDFDVIDYSVLRNIGIIGDDQCILIAS